MLPKIKAKHGGNCLPVPYRVCPEGVTHLLPEGKLGEICLPVPYRVCPEGVSPVLPEAKSEAKRTSPCFLTL